MGGRSRSPADVLWDPGGSIDQQAVTGRWPRFRTLSSDEFPTMNVTWGTYPDNKGHVTSKGCFRCHDDSHEAKDGWTISADCAFAMQIERP